ncbi:MAG TPA: hypothetical protein VIY73_14190 [Polyangiaceae bacterium]
MRRYDLGMVLDARLAKLAHGQTAHDAALAFARSRTEKVAAVERARADEFEAILEAMFLMAAVDGEVAKDEVGQLAASVQAIVDTTGGRFKLDLGPTLDELAARLARDGWKGRLDTLARRLPSPESRAFALRLAAAVAFVDDNVVHAEAAAIDAMAAALAITPDDSQRILSEVHDELFGG